MIVTRLMLCALCLTVFGMIVVAQTESSIRGTIRDERGAAIPGALVSISSLEVRFERGTTSDPNGNYAFSGFPKGRYRVTVKADTFGEHTSVSECVQKRALACVGVADDGNHRQVAFEALPAPLTPV